MNQARPGQARPSQARPGQAKPGQAKPSQARRQDSILENMKKNTKQWIFAYPAENRLNLK